MIPPQQENNVLRRKIKLLREERDNERQMHTVYRGMAARAEREVQRLRVENAALRRDLAQGISAD